MPELLSRGFEAEVYFITPEQRLLVPNADVVKDQFSKDPASYLKGLYELVIAHSLFPEHFIDVVAAKNYHPFRNTHLVSSIAYELQRLTVGHRFLTYSRLATVAENHATYTSHAVRSGRGRDKKSSLDCPDCINHDRLHGSRSFIESVQNAANRIYDAGIVIASYITDVCVNPEGNQAILFEVGSINRPRLSGYLYRLQNPTGMQAHALELLQKYEELDYQTPRLEEWIPL